MLSKFGVYPEPFDGAQNKFCVRVRSSELVLNLSKGSNFQKRGSSQKHSPRFDTGQGSELNEYNTEHRTPNAEHKSIWIIAIGDIVGEPGRKAAMRVVSKLRGKYSPAFIIANGENAAGGTGINKSVATQILDMDVDVITSGDHIWQIREVESFIQLTPKVLRPANFADRDCPGSGVYVVKTDFGPTIGVVNLLGRVFMKMLVDCPFQVIENILAKFLHVDIFVVDFHAEATSEKIAMGRFLDGKAKLVFGTHTHVQTADEKLLSEGTGYITDIGMTGPSNSILGRRVDRILKRFLTGRPTKFEVAKGPIIAQGVILELDANTYDTISIERFSYEWE